MDTASGALVGAGISFDDLLAVRKLCRRRSHWLFIAPLALMIAAAGLSPAAPSVADAAVLTVDRTDDAAAATGCDDATPNDCSLRGAILKANSLSEPVTINVPAGTYVLSQTSNCGVHGVVADLCVGSTVNPSLTITGAGAASTIVNGNQLARVLTILDGAMVAISGVTITNGLGGGGSAGGALAAGGGAILTTGTLALTDCVVSASVSSNGGGGIWNSGALTLLRAQVIGNTSTAGVAAGGGLFNNGGTMMLANSTIQDNAAGDGGGLFNFSPGTPPGTITLDGCTVSANSAGLGGGIFNNNFSVLILINTTISGNMAQTNGGGIENGDSAVVNLNNVTVANNAAALAGVGGGGGIDVVAVANVRNTIIAGNTGGFAPDCEAVGPTFGGPSLTSQGHNLIGNTAFCDITGDTTGNVTGVDPQLGILTDNGGPTQTQALLAGSPAIDAGNPAAPGSGGNACAAIDQRGFLRPQGQACDIGAFERIGNFSLSGILPNQGGNTGSVLAFISGNGFQTGATVKLTQNGVDIVGAPVTVEAGGSAITASFDLTGQAMGPWDVVVMNAGGQTMTLPGAFVIEPTRAPDLWVDVIGRSFARPGQPTSFVILYGNRGNVDALAVPLELSIPGTYLPAALQFQLSPPPPQAGQAALDWSLQPFDILPDGQSGSINIPLLLPIVPAGFTGSIGLTLTTASTAQHGDTFLLLATINPPLFDAALDAGAVAAFVQGAETYTENNFGITIPPALAPNLATYATNQFESAVTSGRSALVSSVGTQSQVYSLAWLQMDLAFSGALEALASPQAMQAPFQRMAAYLVALYDHAVSLVNGSTPAPAYAENPNCPVVPCSHAGILPPGCSCSSGNEPIGPPPIPPPPGCNPKDPSTIAHCGLTKDLCESLPNTKIVQTDQGPMCVPTDFDPKVCPRILGPTETPSAAFKCRGFFIKDSVDPNDKAGSPGVTSQQFLLTGTPFNYFIHFENQATATAPAQQVVITDPLDTQNLDLTTFSLESISFGAITVPLAAGTSHYTGGVDRRPAQNLLVLIDAGLDTTTGIVTWRFTSVDPNTLQLTTDPSAGFLPPNVNPPQGEGSVVFTVQPKPGLPTGTTICNQGQVVFDVNAPIDTPTWCNTIDNSPPTSQVNPLPETEMSADFTVSWTGSDVGSGIANFTIFVSDNGGPFTVWQANTPATSAIFSGVDGHTYAFFSQAQDSAGNVEPLKTQAEAATTVAVAAGSPSETPTDTPTSTPPTDTPTATPSTTPTATCTPTQTPTNSGTQTPTNTPTATPSATPSVTPTDTPTQTPTATPTDTPTNTPSSTPTVTDTSTPTPTPTNTLTPTPTNAPPVCSVAAPSVSTLWPPNRKLVSVSITGVFDPDGDTVTTSITGVTQDEPVTGLGSGDACPDAFGVGTATVQLRAERAGTGNGRVYHVSFTATDSAGKTCAGMVTVCVPHDQGGRACVDAGPLFDSTGPCSAATPK